MLDSEFVSSNQKNDRDSLSSRASSMIVDIPNEIITKEQKIMYWE